MSNFYSEAALFVLSRARKLIEDSKKDKPPFTPEALCQFLNIKKIVNADLGKPSALLFPLQDGFIIKVNQRDGPERQNFSCAHEMAHVFFLSGEGKEIADKLRSELRMSKYARELESLCNLGATEILMPFHIFKSYASQYEYSIRGVHPLANLFQISPQATAIRIGEVNPRPSHVFFWSLSPGDELQAPRLRASLASGIKRRMPSHPHSFYSLKLIRDKTSGIWEAYNEDKIVVSEECLPLPPFKQFCRIESQGFGYGQYRYVISLAFPQSDM